MHQDRKPDRHVLMLGRLAIWLIQRGIELVLGAALALAVLGPNSRGGEFATLEDLRQNLYFVFFFSLTSGYLVTTALLAASRVSSPLLRSWLNVALFVVHAVGFLALTGLASRRAMMLALFGACVVAFSCLVAESLRAWRGGAGGR